MRILTVENTTYELDDIPETVDDLRYGVLDYTNPKNVDYFFIPLIFLESFYSPAAVLRVGEYTVNVPLDWSIVICDPEVGDPEVVSLMSLNDRGFKTYCFNPISGFRPEFHEIDIIDIYPDVKWYFPKMKPGQLLCTPLIGGNKPMCAYFVKEVSRQSEIVDYTKCW